MTNPYEEPDIEYEDCPTCDGHGVRMFFCDGLDFERCEDCKGTGNYDPTEHRREENYDLKIAIKRGK